MDSQFEVFEDRDGNEINMRIHGALEIEGDSMMKAGIMDGDIVLIERCNMASDGEIVVALVDGEEATLKRLRREIGKIILQPENDAYQPIMLDPARVQIQGRLKTLYRRY